MARFQILDLETSIADLSSDITDSILGGVIDCVSEYTDDFYDAFRSGNLDAIPGIIAKYTACVDAGGNI